jgi:hypothetical protein
LLHQRGGQTADELDDVAFVYRIQVAARYGRTFIPLPSAKG